MSVQPPVDEYPFVYDEAEVERLRIQGEFFGELTKDFLLQAGVAEARRVLEVGCGTGEVTRILVEILPPGSTVVAIDPNRDALRALQERAGRWMRERDVRVQCVQAGLEDVQMAEGTFDAAVSRLVLMYLEDPVREVARIARAVRAGGIVACQEADHRSYFATEPPNEVFKRYGERMKGVAEAKGVRHNLGLDLMSIFKEAGLVNLKEMSGVSPRQSGESGVCHVLAGTYVGLLSRKTAEQKLKEVGRLKTELQEEAVRNGLKVYASRLVGVAGKTR